MTRMHALPADRIDDADVQALREAARRFAFLCSGEAGERDWAALHAWRQERPEHERAWQRIEAMRSTLREVPANVASPVLRTTRRQRRAVLKSIVGLTGGAAIGYTAWAALPWARWGAAYRTAAGEQKDVRLVDGSVVSMNTDSAMDVGHDGGNGIRVQLFAGEILVTMPPSQPHPAAARPLTVCTVDGEASGLGARFTVRKRDDDTGVAVYGGEVSIRPLQDRPLAVPAGMQVAFDARAAASYGPVDEDALAWRRGSLVVHDWPLAKVVAEIGRYRAGVVGCSAAVADLRVTGAFPTRDTDRAIAALTKAFPVRAVFVTRYWVRLEAA